MNKDDAGRFVTCIVDSVDNNLRQRGTPLCGYQGPRSHARLWRPFCIPLGRWEFEHLVSRRRLDVTGGNSQIDFAQEVVDNAGVFDCAKTTEVAMTERTKRTSRSAVLTAHCEVIRILLRRPQESD